MLFSAIRRARLLGQYAPLILKLAGYRPTARATASDRIEGQAEKYGSKPAFLFEGRTVSYADLNARANRVAHWARGLGVGKGKVVALLMENRPEYVATWAGVAKTGAVTALINTNLTGKSLRHALATAEADHLVVGSECLDRFETTAGDLERPLEVWVDADPAESSTSTPEGARNLLEALAGVPATNPPRSWLKDVRSGDPIFYIYTSGTTGLPKAARFSHMRFLGIGDLTATIIGETEDDVNYCALPLYHTAGGVMLVSGALSVGATIVLRRRFSASHFWDDCRDHGVTTFQYIGEFCRYLVNRPPDPKDRDHQVRVCIGNGLRPEVWPTFQERFGIPKIVEFYGATEGNTALLNLENKVGSVGRFPLEILSNAKLVRFDVENDVHPRGADGYCIPCETGETGELLGKIPAKDDQPQGRFEGYTSKEATEKKILRDVFAEGDAWFRTGDLLRQDDEGFYYFVDRIGDTFRWKGENVSTQDVAETLAGFGGLEMVNVYGVEVPGGDGRAGMAALYLEEGKSFDPKAFYDYVDDNLPRYAAPVFVRLLDEVEMTGTFKIRKVTLQEQGFDVEKVSDPIYLRDDASKTYAVLEPETAREIRNGKRRL